MTTPEIASGGFFQSKLDSPTSTNYHIIQVLMPIVHPCYPEISGGKQRFTIRFFETNTVEERPLQTQQDINFELRCCMV
jgi:cell division protein ZapD